MLSPLDPAANFEEVSLLLECFAVKEAAATFSRERGIGSQRS
jgi:hypothetical protein